MDSVLTFDSTAVQVLMVLLLALTAIVAFAEKTKSDDRVHDVASAHFCLYVVSVGIVFSLYALASPESANEATFALTCVPLGIGLSAVVFSMAVRTVDPEYKVTAVLAVMVSGLPATALIFMGLFAPAPVLG